MDNLDRILESFKERKILVVGDLALDSYVEGDVENISPEAPVPIFRIQHQYHELGVAGNVASNISSLGGQVCIFSFIGEDREGEILKKLLEERGIEYFLENDSITTTKTRVTARGQQLMRLDKENRNKKTFDSRIKYNLLTKAGEADFIVVSDDANGIVTSDLMSLLEPYQFKMIIDPKPENKVLYKGARLIVPNSKEALLMSGCMDIPEAAKKLRAELGSDLLITGGGKGTYIHAEEILEIPTRVREVYDLSGVGDTVIATLSLALSSQASLCESAILAKYAAGIAIEKRGTYSVRFGELKNRVHSEGKKIVSIDDLVTIVDELKRNDKKVIWTNGCFDILHVGHTKYLEKAKELGDVLIVGVTSDDGVRREKGPERPINAELERAEILASMGFIDYITIYPFQGAKNYIARLKPDVYVKGGTYTLESINQEERKIVEDYGGEIVLGIGVPNKSTTRIIKSIKQKKEE